MNLFNTIAEKIIVEQENIMGPVAWEQAGKIQGLIIDPKKREVFIEGNETEVVERLVEQYQQLFGRASVEVCKEAVHSLISQIPGDKIPNLLRY